MRTSVLASGFIVLAACTTDAFQGDDAGEDAAKDASTSDAITTDSSGGGDAIASDGGKSDGGVSFSCSPARAGSLLCDTFDNVATVTTMWTAALVNSTASVALDTSTSVSSPKSYKSEIQKGSSPGYTFGVLLFEDTNATYTTMSMRASVRIHTIDPSQPIPLIDLGYPSALGTGKVTVTLGTAGGEFILVYSQPTADAGVVSSSGVDLGPHKLDTWHSVQLDFKQAPSASIKVWIDGVLVSSTSPVLNLPASSSKIRDFDVGIAGANSADMLVNFDDIDCAGF